MNWWPSQQLGVCLDVRIVLACAADDAIRAIRLYVSAVADSVAEGKANAQPTVSADEFVEVDESEVAPPVAEISEAVAASVNQTFAAEDEEKGGHDVTCQTPRMKKIRKEKTNY